MSAASRLGRANATLVGETAKLHSDLEALVGSTIHGRYEVETLLGVGGMGAVFKARHTGLQRGVAIKVLHPEIGRDESVSKRFDREAQSASRLDHPNCVRVTDFGTTENGTKYLVMELLEGGDLDGRLGQPWAPDRAVATIEAVLRGLEHAHHVGIVHRDLKPENIFVTKDFRGDEVVKIVDFGIAKLIDEQGSEKLTRQGIVFGTPRYMAPEQAAGGKLDERTDLYAVGLIFYELLAGHPPFQSDEAAQLLRMQIMAPPPPLPASVPAPLAEIVAKLIEKSKNDRYASAREVLDALAQATTAIAAAAAPTVVVAQPVTAPSSSGVAWQPAPEPTPAISGATLAASAVELAAVSMSAAAYPSLPNGSQPSMSVASVAAQPTAPQRSRSWLPIVLASVTLLLVLSGVAVLVSSMDDDGEPTANEQAAEPVEQPPAAVVTGNGQPAGVPRAAPANTAESSNKPTREASNPSSRPVRPTPGPDAKPKSKPDSGDSKDSEQKKDQSGGSSDSTVPQDSTIDPARDSAGDPSAPKPDSEADAEQAEQEREEHDAKQREDEKNREQAKEKENEKGKGKGKGNDKKKPV
jgi:serine/threonine protein kinase